MNPLKRLWEFVFVSVPARFPSDFSVNQSVERLRANTRRTIFSALFRQAALGPVSESRVRLQRVIPLFGDSFKPIFVGRLVTAGLSALHANAARSRRRAARDSPSGGHAVVHAAPRARGRP